MNKASVWVSAAAAAVVAGSSAIAMDTATGTVVSNNTVPSGRGSTETLNFYGFTGYYGYITQAYGGFNFTADFLYMNATTWTDPNGPGYQNGWCNTGYQNEAAMSNATSLGVIYQYGLMESASTKHTFTLDSMNVAASFSKNAVWDITSYTEGKGYLVPKAEDKFRVSFTGEYVKLSTLGKSSDFKDIVAVAFQLQNYGHPGNKCTYGYPIVGAQLAIGNVKVTWSTATDLSGNTGILLTPYLLQHPSFALPRVTGERQGNFSSEGASSLDSHQYRHTSAGHDPGTSP
jgi:hypothetical protein